MPFSFISFFSKGGTASRKKYFEILFSLKGRVYHPGKKTGGNNSCFAPSRNDRKK